MLATVPPSVEEEEAASEVSVPVLSVAAELLVLPQAARLSAIAAAMLNASAFLICFSPLRLFSDWRTLLQVPPDTNYSKRNGTQKQGEILPKEVQKIIQIEQYAKKYFFEIVSVAQFLYQNDTDHMFFPRSTSRAHTKGPRLIARKGSARQPAIPLCESRASDGIVSDRHAGFDCCSAARLEIASLRTGSLSEWIKDIKMYPPFEGRKAAPAI